MAFTHLHVHTQYSILDGLSSIKGLFSRAKELGMPALAITDHGNMYGVKEFMNTAKKFPEVKPIIGCEIYVTTHYDHTIKDNAHRSYYHLILLAKNYEGYRNLMKIVSTGHIEGNYYGKPRVSHEIVEKYHEGLVCCSACLAGEVPRAIIAGDLDAARKAIEWHRGLFGEDYYLEVMSHPTQLKDLPPDVFASVHKVYEYQQKVNEGIFMLSDETGVKVVATNDVHFVAEEDGPVHDRLVCLTMNNYLDEPDRVRYTQQEWLKSEEEMAALFPSHPEVLATTQEIVDKIESYKIDRDHVLPKFELPEDFLADIDNQLEKYKPIIDEGRYSVHKDKDGNETREYRGDEFCRSVAYLCHKTFEGAHDPRRYGENLTDEQQERLDFELKTICRMGFPDYFLIVADYIAASREEGFYVGPGRGSAAGSAVAYCMGITNLDPIRYDLLFERFLNPDRISMPDIDVDFEDLVQAHGYVEKKYSKSHVSRVITFGTMAAKSAIKDVCRISRISLEDSNRLSKMVPDRPFTVKENGEEKEAKPTLSNCFKYLQEFKDEFAKGREDINEMLHYAEKIEGSIRQVGVHACATIIGRGDLSEYIPLSTAKDKETGLDVLISQYDGHYIEEVGMLKMDFLGLNTLSIMKECINNIRLRTGEAIDIDAIPDDDRLTYELYSRGDTDSVFQFESPGMKKWLQKLHPERLEDLIAMNALYRPGPMEYIPDFVLRKQGKQAIAYDLPAMEGRLKETYGITVYQEQVMLLSRDLAGFTRGESDKLRKAMGKKQLDVLESLHEKFLNGGIANGHPKDVLEKIWNDWRAFASYAFNKSHATCYAWVSYQTAWLKAHYTSDFLAANMTCNLGKMDEIKAIMADCRAHRIKVMIPDVNESLHKFTVNRDGNIRFGLSGIKGLGDNVVNKIIAERENGLFADIFDFTERMCSILNKRTFESLLFSGALDGFGLPRSQYLVMSPNGELFLDELVHYAEMLSHDTFDAGASLFGNAEEIKPQRPEIPHMTGEADTMELLKKEKELVGMYLSAHPLDTYRLEIEEFTTPGVNCANIEQLVKDCDESKKPCPVTIAGYVVGFERKTSKNGNPWGEAMLEDFEGSYSVRLRGRDFEKLMSFFQEHNSLLLEGKIDEAYYRKPEDRKTLGDPEYGFKIQNVCLLGNIMAERVKSFAIWANAGNADERKRLVKLLRASKGKTPVVLYLNDPVTGYCVEFAAHKMHIRPNAEMCDELTAMGIKWKLLK